MLPVIVCDDDSFTLHTISELLKRSIESCGQNARIACLTASGRELLGFIQKNPGTYLYFLDFDLGRQELNGSIWSGRSTRPIPRERSYL